MPTQLEQFEYRVEVISKQTSDATIASETYLNDVTILLEVVKNIDLLIDMTGEARCPLCETRGGHSDVCPLYPLYQKYTGLTHKLPRRDTRKGAWEEPERGPNHYEKDGDDKSQPGYVGKPSTKQKVKGTQGRKPAPFRIWQIPEKGKPEKGLMEFKGTQADSDKLKERYTAGKWKAEMEYDLPNGEHYLLMSVAGSEFLPFIEAIKQERAESTAANLSSEV